MKSPQILLLPPQKKNGSPGSSPDWFTHYPLGWPNFDTPEPPLQNKVQTDITLVFANHFCHRKMGFADFCYRWWQLKYVQFFSPIPGEIIQFHLRILFQMARRKTTNSTSFGVSASPNLP